MKTRKQCAMRGDGDRVSSTTTAVRSTYSLRSRTANFDKRQGAELKIPETITHKYSLRPRPAKTKPLRAVSSRSRTRDREYSAKPTNATAGKFAPARANTKLLSSSVSMPHAEIFLPSPPLRKVQLLPKPILKNRPANNTTISAERKLTMRTRSSPSRKCSSKEALQSSRSEVLDIGCTTPTSVNSASRKRMLAALGVAVCRSPSTRLRLNSPMSLHKVPPLPVRSTPVVAFSASSDKPSSALIFPDDIFYDAVDVPALTPRRRVRNVRPEAVVAKLDRVFSQPKTETVHEITPYRLEGVKYEKPRAFSNSRKSHASFAEHTSMFSGHNLTFAGRTPLKLRPLKTLASGLSALDSAIEADVSDDF